MNTISKLKKLALVSFAIILISLSGCSDYFSNPLENKENGEDINLVILDFNFFHTRMTFKLVDAKTGEIIKANSTLQFSGKNGNDIVSYTGEKNENYETSEGQVELTIDPNISISAGSPFDFSVNVDIEGYNTLSKGFSLNSEGIKTFELLLSKKSDEEDTDLTGDVDFGDGDTVFHFIAPAVGLKSLLVETPYNIDHSFTIDDLMKFRDKSGAPLFSSKTEAFQAYSNDPENFIKVSVSKFTNYPAGVDVVNFGNSTRNALFHKLETGSITKMLVASKEVASLNGGKITSKCSKTEDFMPLILGFVQFENNHWNLLGATLTSTSLNFSYTLATVSAEELCQTGSSITFKANVISSFSIDADVYDKDNKLITSMSFKGNFPQTFVVENVPSKAVKLVFRNNNPSFNQIAPLEIASFCSGNYEVNVTPAAGYQQYQITLKALCRNNKELAIAPTYGAQVKLNNSEIWQEINMKGGIVDYLGLPNEDYQLRLLWKNEWEYSSYSTKFDATGNYLGEPKPDTKVKSKKLGDGRMQISVEKTFEQNICDDLGW
ncbi:MAG TPA: hypothetical protein P5210_02520 [Draconibacterium sp.]|nr:hypothetical protein [Draconibacterium sp.]